MSERKASQETIQQARISELLASFSRTAEDLVKSGSWDEQCDSWFTALRACISSILELEEEAHTTWSGLLPKDFLPKIKSAKAMM